MKNITLQSKTYQLPEDWTEVDQKKIPILINLLALPASGETYREILRVLLKISKKEWQKFINYHFDEKKVSKQLIRENAIALHELIIVVSWMWRKSLSVKPFLFLKEPKTDRHLFLPDPDLKYLSWGELADALTHYEVFTSQLIEGEKHLDLLIATICRPARPLADRKNPTWNGDPRIPYNSFIAEEDAQKIAPLPLSDKMVILIYFGGIASGLFKIYQLGNSGSESEEYPGQNFIKNTFNLAEKHIFGNFDQTREKNCHEVLIFLEENKKDIEAQEEEYRKSNL